jgi:predicted ArsR family transcriptional regulator
MTGVRSDETAELSARRRTVLYAVRRRGEATVEEIADQLAMTASGARQHLNALMADGLVEATEFEPDEPRRGRRTIVYSATEAANVHFPKAYGELTNELLGYVRDADPDLIAAIFARRREHRIAGATARLGHLPTLGRKVAELARILDEDGYFARAEEVVPGRSPSGTAMRARARSTSSGRCCRTRKCGASSTWLPARVGVRTRSGRRLAPLPDGVGWEAHSALARGTQESAVNWLAAHAKGRHDGDHPDHSQRRTRRRRSGGRLPGLARASRRPRNDRQRRDR